MGKRAKKGPVDPHIEDVGSASESSVADSGDDSESNVGKKGLPLSNALKAAPTPQRAVSKPKSKRIKVERVEQEPSGQGSSSGAAGSQATKILKLQGPQVHAEFCLCDPNFFKKRFASKWATKPRRKYHWNNIDTKSNKMFQDSS